MERTTLCCLQIVEIGGQMTLPLDLEAGMFTNRRLSETNDLSLERHIRGREHMRSLLCLLAREGEQQKQGHYYTTS